MSSNPIPYHYGAEAKIADVSGETFILGLMTMTPVNIDEKFRDNYITVDPPALAGLLDIRVRCTTIGRHPRTCVKRTRTS